MVITYMVIFIPRELESANQSSELGGTLVFGGYSDNASLRKGRSWSEDVQLVFVDE